MVFLPSVLGGGGGDFSWNATDDLVALESCELDEECQPFIFSRAFGANTLLRLGSKIPLK